jgi:hypothetical protein
MVAGADDPDDPFSRYAAAAGVLLPRGVSAVTVLGSDAGAAERVIAAINAGVGLVDYAGHGSQEEWVGGLMSSDVAEGLTNGAATPLVLAMTCLNGYFQDVWAPSLAEAFLSAPGGGAVAVWASSGLTMAAPQAAMNQALLKAAYGAVYGGSGTLGEAITAAKAAVTDQDVKRSWILFGDPAMSLR